MRLHGAAFAVVLALAFPSPTGKGSEIDWKSELKKPAVQRILNEYITSHCMITGPLDDKEWQADHGKPRKVASLVCSED
jgi:hypothetical protein